MSDDDENHLIAERRAKLAKLRERGAAFPNDFRRNALAARPADRLRREERRGARGASRSAVSVAGRMRAKRVMGKASFAQARGFERRDPGVPAAAERSARCTMSSRPGTSAISSAPRGACSAPRPASCRCAPSASAAHQVAAAAARQVARHRRHRAALSPPLRRSDHERGEPAGVRDALARSCATCALFSIRAAFSRSRRRCCIRSRAAPRRGPSRRITTRSTSTCTCASRRSCI